MGRAELLTRREGPCGAGQGAPPRPAAVHPGTVDLADDSETVNKLFKLVNLIVEEMITKPREINGLYEELPETAE